MGRLPATFSLFFCFLCLSSKSEEKSAAHFVPLGPEKEDVTAIAFTHSKVLMAISNKTLKKFDSTANKWEVYDTKAPAELSSAYSLALNDQDDIFVGTQTRAGMFRLKGGKTEWVSINAKTQHVHFISHIVIDPKDPRHIFALRNSVPAFFTKKETVNPEEVQVQLVMGGVVNRNRMRPPTTPIEFDGPSGGYLFESKDGGDHWTIPFRAKTGPLKSLSMDNQGNLILGGGNNVARSTDGGKTFETLPSPPTAVETVTVGGDGVIVAAGTLLYLYDPNEKKWKAGESVPQGGFSVRSDNQRRVFLIVESKYTTWKSDEVYLLKDGQLEPVTKGVISLFAKKKDGAPSFTRINCVTSGEKGELLFGTDQGVFSLEGL